MANEELKERNKQLLDARVTAATDGLTGLLNHRTFHEDVRLALNEAQAASRPVALAMMDLDGFKEINDTLGHLAGDEVLRQVSIAIQVACPGQQPYRYGGDEFAVILQEHSEEEARIVAERLRVAVQSVSVAMERNVIISIGVASFPQSASTAEELIYGADAAMYWSKSLGKNRVEQWSGLAGNREQLTEAARRSQLIRVA
jgi:diguanylate cyclase (GGDEF)-like protein